MGRNYYQGKSAASRNSGCIDIFWRTNLSQKVFHNDKIVDASEACISPTDSGFLYGAGVFETMVAFNGEVFALEDHLNRLFFSLKSLSFPVDFDREFIKDAIYKTIAANDLVDARLRLTITNGPMSFTGQPKPTVIITATLYQGYPEEYYKEGVRVVLTSFRQNPSNPVFSHKTTNYLPRLMAMNNARQQGAAEALWFTVNSTLAEGCMSNVFLVKDGKLFTPAVETPVLPGVARGTICKLALGNEIELVEKDLLIKDLLDADEIFLSNVVMRVLPVTSVEKHVVGNGKVGDVTKKISQLYLSNLAKYCGFGEDSK